MEFTKCLALLTCYIVGYLTPTECKTPTKSEIFPGRCDQGHCSQSCRDLPDDTGFVCICDEGFTLHANGFSCIETIRNPATTIPSQLYDLDAAEQSQSEGDDDVGAELQDLTQGENVEDAIQDLGEEHPTADEIEEEKETEGDWDDTDTDDLNELTKRSKNRDRNRNRNPNGSRRKNKDKNRKGKGRKDKTKNNNKYYVSVNQPMNDVYVKEGKMNKGKSLENEVESTGRHMNCYDLMCKGGGKCVPDEMRAGGGVRCQCPLGKEGEFCEREIDVKFPKFLGTGYMAFPTLRGAYKDMSITIEFKPDTHNGLLLYSGDFPHPMSDFFSVALVDGHVEFRFDCGTGMAKIRTHNMIELGQWNTLTVKRSDWYGYVQLNDGANERGRSKGLFSRITFREDLYLGGYKNTSQLGTKTGMQWGFVGCVRFLEINSKVYDMRQGAFVGDAIHGVDVGECSSNVCDSIKCLNGGTCMAESADTSVCLCPLGKAGDRCENRIDIHVPAFSGNSYLKFLGLGQSALSYLDGEVVFKATEPTGLIVYNGYATDRTGDFLSLALMDGFVDFRFDLGTGPAVIRSREPVSMNEWHVVKFKRTGRNGEITVDNQAPVTGLSKGGYTQLTLTLDLFVGGHRNFDEVAKKAQVRSAFKGCIQKVVVNERSLSLMEQALSGVNIDNCEHPCKGQPCLNGGRCVPIKDFYRCSCPVGFENSNCEDIYGSYVSDAAAPPMTIPLTPDIQEPVTIPQFSGTSYMTYREDPREHFQYRDPDRQMKVRLNGETSNIEFRIKTTSPDGLIFWIGEKVMEHDSDYMAIGLRDGFVQFSFNLGSGEAVLTNKETRVSDGKWHKIRAQRYRMVGYLEVDGMNLVEGTSPGSLAQFNVQDDIFIGGLPDVQKMSNYKFSTGFSGCLNNITLGDSYHVDLPESNEDIINVQQCGGL